MSETSIHIHKCPHDNVSHVQICAQRRHDHDLLHLTYLYHNCVHHSTNPGLWSSSQYVFAVSVYRYPDLKCQLQNGIQQWQYSVCTRRGHDHDLHNSTLVCHVSCRWVWHASGVSYYSPQPFGHSQLSRITAIKEHLTSREITRQR